MTTPSSATSATSATPPAPTPPAPLSSPAPLVVIVVSSRSDQSHADKIAQQLSSLGVDHETRVCSAVKTPARLLELVAKYEASRRARVYVAVSGRSNALGALIDAHVSAPVIACPVYSDAFAGADVYSSLRSPGGVAPMVVLDPQAAALAAAKILSLADARVGDRVRRLHAENAAALHVQDCEVRSAGYIPRILANVNATYDRTDLKLQPQPQAGAGAAAVDKYVGKVRDRYSDGRNVVLVTTDRLTGFDRPLAKIPYKGAVLNLVSKWWFEETAHIMKNHVVSVPHPNVTIGVAVKPFPIEFVVRGYITGSTGTSMWTHYANGVREYAGIKLPEGLVQHQKLWRNLITPTTKSDEHDELITPEQIVARGYMTQEEWDYCSRKALELFEFGQRVALQHGLILADTKMEMGRAANGEIILIDELFTPDSSRYWIASTYDQAMAQGKSPQNVDKEIVRNWIRERCDPYKTEVLPVVPAEVVAELSRRYIMLYETITGLDFDFPATSDVELAVQEALDKLRV